MRLGAKLSVATPAQPGSAEAKAAIGRDGLVDFRWDLAVGDHTLTGQEVADLVAAQEPLVRVRGLVRRPGWSWRYAMGTRLLIVNDIPAAVRRWRGVAGQHGLSERERLDMAPAFRRAETA